MTPLGALLRFSQEFQPEPNTVRSVREFVCRSFGVGLGHPMVLIASELATNAVIHAGTPYRVDLDDGADLRIEVHDGKSIERMTQQEDSRGLRLVDRLSRRWGVEETRSGKFVWAVTALASEL